MKIVLENMFGVIVSRKGGNMETQETVWEGVIFKNTKNSEDSDSIPTTLRNVIPYTSSKTLPILTIPKTEQIDNKQTPINEVIISQTPKYEVLKDIPNFVDPFNPKAINNYVQGEIITINPSVADILIKNGNIKLI